MTNEHVFCCSSFSILLGSNQLFAPLSVKVERGQVVHIMGDNGAGKSTLLRYLSTENVRHTGEVAVRPAASDILYLPQIQLIRSHLPFTLEEVSSLFACQSLQPGSLVKKQRRLLSEFPDWFNAEQRGKNWNDASGGERMRALLAGALRLSDRAVLLLDEPLNHLDSRAMEAFQDDVLRLVESQGRRVTAFLVSHAPLELLSVRLRSRYQPILLQKLPPEVGMP